MSQLFKLSVPGRYENLALIGEFIATVARRANLCEKAIFDTQLAVDEACTNIIQHAYCGEGLGDVSLEVSVSDGELRIVLRDRGRTFDPTKVPAPNLSCKLSERGNGGLGMHFMRNLMDTVCYECDPEAGNILTMVKRQQP